MIGKILNISFQKITNSVHGEMEQNKRRSPQEKSNSNEKKERSSEASVEVSLEVSKGELISWINELNLLECYVVNKLHFTLSDEGRYFLIKLIDKNEHTLQEYLPVQFKALYSQIKTDRDDSKKGTILNLNC